MQQYSLDLAKFAKLILRNGLILLISLILGAAVSWGLASLQTPTWKATAQFDKPKVQQLGNYFNLFATYQFLNGGDPISYKLLKDEKGSFSLAPEVTTKAEESAADTAYNEFKRSLTSPDVLQLYLTQVELVKQNAKAQNKPIATVAQEYAKQFAFQQATKSVPVDRFSVTSTNPEEASQLLAGFIWFANEQSKITLYEELTVKWKALHQQIQAAVETKLGATQQAGQIVAQDWQGKLNMMTNVSPLDNKLNAYRLIKAPSVPQSSDSPNKSFWLLIGALSGLLGGIALVSLLTIFSRKKNDQTN